MIERGWCRSFINKQINRVKKLFSWAAGEELLPLSVYQALTRVAGLRLRAGRREPARSRRSGLCPTRWSRRPCRS
jgi:hypothetical protein